jgi:hypothetical protein
VIDHDSNHPIVVMAGCLTCLVLNLERNNSSASVLGHVIRKLKHQTEENATGE